MNTDDFTTAARAEAEKLTGPPVAGETSWDYRWLFEAGAEWARDYIALPGTSNDMLDSVAAAISECDGIYFPDLLRRNPGIAHQYRKQAMAAMTAVERNSGSDDPPAAQEPTDAECIAILNAVTTPFGEKTMKGEWAYAAIQRCREAMVSARAVRAE